jgi:hypothetical protein
MGIRVATGNSPELQALTSSLSPPTSSFQNGRKEKINATAPPAMTTISPGVGFLFTT